MKHHWFGAAVLIVALFLALPLSLIAQGNGSLGSFITTSADGATVNGSQFASKCSVYLSARPGPGASKGRAGLPDGDYYFQVTDPSGAELLSTDPVNNRGFRVHAGVIVQRYGTHPVGVDMTQAASGALTVALAGPNCAADLLDSGNGGGMYKVWITPAEDFRGDPSKVENSCSKGCFHGFVAAASRTDSFKTKSSADTLCLNVQKLLLNGDNVTYSPAPNWRITVTDPQLVQNAYATDASGQVNICGLPAGTYLVQEQVTSNDACPFGSFADELLVNNVAVIPDSAYSFTWSASKGSAASVVIVFKNKCNPGLG